MGKGGKSKVSNLGEHSTLGAKFKFLRNVSTFAKNIWRVFMRGGNSLLSDHRQSFLDIIHARVNGILHSFFNRLKWGQPKNGLFPKISGSGRVKTPIAALRPCVLARQ